MAIVTVGMDLAKNVFALHAVDENGSTLLVSWCWKGSGSLSRKMPTPLSSTAITRTPPAGRRTVTCVAPASSALSTSSRTT